MHGWPALPNGQLCVDLQRGRGSEAGQRRGTNRMNTLINMPNSLKLWWAEGRQNLRLGSRMGRPDADIGAGRP